MLSSGGNFIEKENIFVKRTGRGFTEEVVGFLGYLRCFLIENKKRFDLKYMYMDIRIFDKRLDWKSKVGVLRVIVSNGAVF